MNDEIAVLVKQVCSTGAMIYPDPPDIIIEPASIVPTELKARLKQRKAEVLQYIEELSRLKSLKELDAAHVNVAVWDDGRMRIVITEVVRSADNRVLFSPQDMAMYVSLSAHERRMLYAFKRQFGGETEWKQS